MRQALRGPDPWLLLALAAVYFHRPLFAGETFYFRDLLLYAVPQRTAIARLLRDGVLPLWNPFLHGGYPLLADVSSGALYPSTALYLVFSPYRALSLDLVLHVAAASVLAYACARVFGIGRVGALLAGVVFAYCGSSLSLTNVYDKLLALPYLPALVLFWQLFLRHRAPRYFALAVAAGGLQIFSGGAEVAAFTHVTLLLVTVISTVPSRPGARSSWVALVALWLSIVGVAAIQLTPLYELVQQSSRGAGLDYESWARWSLPPAQLPELAIPGFFGAVDTLDERDYWGAALVDEEFPYLVSVHVGLLTLILAAAGARYATLEARTRILLVALAAAATVAALGSALPGSRWLYDHLPLLRAVRYPIKFLIAASLPLALLCGAGVESLSAGGARRARRWAVAIGVTAALTLGLALWLRGAPASALASIAAYFPGSTPQIVARGLARSLVVMGVGLSMATVALLATRLQGRHWQSWMVAGAAAAILLLAGRPVVPTAPAAWFAERPPVLASVESTLDGGRLYRSPDPAQDMRGPPTDDLAWRYRLLQDRLDSYRAFAYGIPVVYHSDFDGLGPARVVELGRVVESLPWERRAPLLSAAGVRVVVTSEDAPSLELVDRVATASNLPLLVYRHPNPAQPVELVTTWLAAKAPGEALEAMLGKGFDPRRHGVIEGASDDGSGAPCPTPLQVSWTKKTIHRWRFDVVSACPGYLVFDQPHYPGWEVRVNGVATPIVRANYAFSAIDLPAGAHSIVRVYRPRSVLGGALVSAATVALLSVGLVIAIVGRS